MSGQPTSPVTERPRPARTGAALDARRILADTERRAEHLTTQVRIVTSGVLIVIGWIAAMVLEASDSRTLAQLEVARITLCAWLVVGLLAWLAQALGAPAGRVGVAAITGDALIVLAHLAYGIQAFGAGPRALFLFPVMWMVPLLLAAVCLRCKPGLQIYAGSLYVAGFVVVLSVPAGPGADGGATIASVVPLLSGPVQDGVRIAGLLLFAAVLVLLAGRGRGLVVRAAEETERRWTLSRYLPVEVLPMLASDDGNRLTCGRRRVIAAMFVDLRGSTAISRHMDPERLAVLIGDYRGVLLDRARAHGAVLDKFIGDGALIVFGVLDGERQVAARAIACALDLTAALAAWSEARGRVEGVELRFGIGLHYGPSFVGVVGNEDRREFTVIGETSNIAAKLEKEAARSGQRLLVSRATFDAAEWPLPDPAFEPSNVALPAASDGTVEVFALAPRMLASESLTRPVLPTFPCDDPSAG